MDFGLQEIFLFVAIPATVFLVLQTILLFLGIGGSDADAEMDMDGGQFDGGELDLDGDADADADVGDGGDDFVYGTFHLFTFRNLVGFFSMFGWGGIAMLKNGYGAGASITVAVFLGFKTMFLMALFLRLILSRQS
jgi:hypothetical protein